MSTLFAHVCVCIWWSSLLMCGWLVCVRMWWNICVCICKTTTRRDSPVRFTFVLPYGHVRMHMFIFCKQNWEYLLEKNIPCMFYQYPPKNALNLLCLCLCLHTAELLCGTLPSIVCDEHPQFFILWGGICKNNRSYKYSFFIWQKRRWINQLRNFTFCLTILFVF